MKFFSSRSRAILAGLATCAVLLLTPSRLPAQTPVWQALGPHGGSVYSLAVHPSNPRVLYAGGELPAVERSTDAGASWQWLPGSLALSLVAVDPTRPTTVYAAARFPCRISKSTDGGGHWDVVSRNLPTDLVPLALAVDPARPARIYLASNNKGVWRSADGGANWQFVGERLPVYVTALTVPRRPAGTVFAATPSGVFRSRGAGKDWKRLRNGLPDAPVQALALAPSDPRTLYASLGLEAVYRSQDGGDTWSPAGRPASPEHPVFSLAVDPRSPRTVYAGTVGGGLFKTTDGGAHWRLTAAPPGSNVQTLAVDATGTVYAGTEGLGINTGGILRSADGGASWTRANRGLAGLPGVSVAVDPGDPDVLVTALNGFGLFRTASGGPPWVRTRAGFPQASPQAGVQIAQVLAPEPGTFYAWDVVHRRLWKSTDAGATWNPGPGPGDQVRVLRADPLDPETLYALTAGDSPPALYRGADGGASWVRLADPPFNCGIEDLAVARASASTPAVLYLAGARPSGLLNVCRTLNRPAVFRSGDGGASWTLADSGLDGEDVATLAVDPRDSRVLYAGMGFGHLGLPFGVWKSTDAGASWQRSGLQDRVIAALAASPTGSLWAGALGGQVFRSVDGEASWQDRDGGIHLEIHEFTFDPNDPSRVYAAGFGGVWLMTETIP